MTNPSPFSVITVCAVLALSAAATNSDEQPIAEKKSTGAPADPQHRETCVKVLKPLGVLVGEWKGVGQPRRGSNLGAWSEKAQAAWKFDEKQSGLVLNFDPGQHYKSVVFSVAKDAVTPELYLMSAGGQTIQLKRNDESTAHKTSDKPTKDVAWVFESSPDALPQTRQASYRRLSEIGLTRAGARLARGNSGERQCIVTGGLGTIKVSHEGKTYFVCCEGCQQAFAADPAGTIAAYQERLKEASEKEASEK